MLLDGNTVPLETFIDEAGEGDAVVTLKEKYSKYGFKFTEAVYGMDYVDVESYDGHTHRLSLDPYGSSYEEAEKLKEFLRTHAVDKTAQEIKDIKEQEGLSLGESTPEIDALINKVTELSQNPEVNKDEIDALNARISQMQKAKIKGETLDWRQEYFKKEDLEWGNIDDQLAPLRKERKTATEARQKEIDKEIARIRWEAGMSGKINIAEEEIMRLEARINDIESNPADTQTKNIGYDPKFPQYEEVPVLSKAQEAEIARLEGEIDEMIAENPALGSGKYTTAKLETDRILARAHRVTAEKATKENNKLKEEVSEIDKKSIEKFGVPLSKLSTVTLETQEDVDAANQLIAERTIVRDKEIMTAQTYRMSGLYFDEKTNKGIQEEFVGEWEGFTNQMAKGFSQGVSVTDMLKVEAGAHTDKEFAQILAAEEAYRQTLYDSEAVAKFNGAKTFAEQLSVFGNDPFEIIGGLAANSLAMMLPIAAHIMPTTMAVGGVIGFTGGLGFGALPGLIGGAEVGMFMTTTAMEYGNTIMDTMRQSINPNTGRHYDLSNPDDIMAGLADKEVMNTGRLQGLIRGVTIGAVDKITGNMLGRFANPFINKWANIGGTLAGATVISPITEGMGEAAAQILSGQGYKATEVFAEMVGGPGMTATQTSMSILRELSDANQFDLGKKISFLPDMMQYGQSAATINKWADKALAAGVLNKRIHGYIKQNSNIKSQVDQKFDLVKKGTSFNLFKNRDGRKIKNALTNLIFKRQKLELNPDGNKEQIKELTEAIDNIVKNKKVDQSATNLSDSIRKEMDIDKRELELENERDNLLSQNPLSEKAKLKREIALDEVYEGLKGVQQLKQMQEAGVDIQSLTKPFQTLSKKEKAQRVTNLKKVAEKVGKSLGKIIDPKMIHVADSQEAYNKAVKDAGLKLIKGESAAVDFDKDTGKLKTFIVNAALADEKSVMHEAFHVVLQNTFGNDQKRFATFQQDISSRLKKAGYGNLARRMAKFSKQYEKGVRSEEFLVELGAALTDDGFDAKTLTDEQKTILQQIAEMINKIIREVTGNEEATLDENNPQDILSFLTETAANLKTGQEVGTPTKVTTTKQKKAKANREARKKEMAKKRKEEREAKEKKGFKERLTGAAKKKAEQVKEMLEGISEKKARGERAKRNTGKQLEIEFSETDIEALAEGASVPIGKAKKLKKPGRRSRLGKKIKFEKSYPLSYVKPSDSLDLLALIDEIIAKGQQVMFWTADQLGRGIYEDVVINKEHFLDAGPSYALDPTHREEGRS